MKRERPPTREEFEKLLAWFDSDPDKAASTFNHTHSRLIRVFGLRGCVDDEALADEVINRVAVRIDTVMKNYSDPLRCCVGFVANVYREYDRERQKNRDAKPPPQPRPSDELEKEDKCLKECLESLAQAERDLFEGYFQVEKRERITRRKKIAEKMKISINALRIRAHHVRKQMHQCIVNCVNLN